MTAKDKETKLLQLVDTYLTNLLNQVDKRRISTKKKNDLVKSTVIQAFKNAGLGTPDIPEGVIELRDLLGRESDRGCVLSAAAFLDYELGRLLRKVLIQDEELCKGLFEGYGPLASFSSRIDLAYGLGYLAPLQRRDLHLIRKIRNIFAHRTGDVTFDDSEIASRCQELHHDVFDEKLSARRKFMRVAIGIAAPIHVGIMTASTPSKANEFNISDPQFKKNAAQVLSRIKKSTNAPLRKKRGPKS